MFKSDKEIKTSLYKMFYEKENFTHGRPYLSEFFLEVLIWTICWHY